MPLLAKEQSSISVLADAEKTETPCEKIVRQTAVPPPADEQAPAPKDDVQNIIEKAKNSDWLPWAVAGGFALLWMNKSK